MGTVSKITVEEIQEILRDKIERTLLHSLHIVTDTNTFIEKEVQKKIKEIDEEEVLLNSQIEQNYEKVLEHIEKEVQGVSDAFDMPFIISGKYDIVLDGTLND